MGSQDVHKVINQIIKLIGQLPCRYFPKLTWLAADSNVKVMDKVYLIPELCALSSACTYFMSLNSELSSVRSQWRMALPGSLRPELRAWSVHTTKN